VNVTDIHLDLRDHHHAAPKVIVPTRRKMVTSRQTMTIFDRIGQQASAAPQAEPGFAA
jgi:hypothetical protein